jgi:hypothetical protein
LKSIFIVLFFLFPFLLSAQDYPYSEDEVKPFGISLTGTLKISNSISLSRGFETREINTVPGYGLGLEYYIIQGDNRNAGAGFEYQFPNEIYGIDGTFQNLPLYLFYELSIIKLKYVALPYIHLQLGYNFLLLSDDFIEPGISSGNGWFYGFGFSSRVTRNLNARLTFSSNLGKISDNAGEWFFSNNKINITLTVVL